jgi:hypothetical protein
MMDDCVDGKVEKEMCIILTLLNGYLQASEACQAIAYDINSSAPIKGISCVRGKSES